MVKAIGLMANSGIKMYLSASPKEMFDSHDDQPDQFSMFSIYRIVPALSDLCGMNIKTTVPARKNRERQSGR